MGGGSRTGWAATLFIAASSNRSRSSWRAGGHSWPDAVQLESTRSASFSSAACPTLEQMRKRYSLNTARSASGNRANDCIGNASAKGRVPVTGDPIYLGVTDRGVTRAATRSGGDIASEDALIAAGRALTLECVVRRWNPQRGFANRSQTRPIRAQEIRLVSRGAGIEGRCAPCGKRWLASILEATSCRDPRATAAEPGPVRLSVGTFHSCLSIDFRSHGSGLALQQNK